jgi:hypothetical protein
MEFDCFEATARQASHTCHKRWRKLQQNLKPQRTAARSFDTLSSLSFSMETVNALGIMTLRLGNTTIG